MMLTCYTLRRQCFTRGLQSLALVLLCITYNACVPLIVPPHDEVFSIVSTETGDNYTVYVKLPPNYVANRRYPVFYHTDANLHSNHYAEILGALMSKGKIPPAIIVGIAQPMNIEPHRRRDLVQGYERKGDLFVSDNAWFGQSDQYYAFLKNTLIPDVERRYATNGQRTLAGHSFGGLFAVYVALKGEGVFQKYLAISPSLWVNYGNINEIADAWHPRWINKDAKLYLCAGSLESINQVLPAVNRFYDHLTGESTDRLQLIRHIFEGKNHETIVEEAIEKGGLWLQ